MMKKFFVIFSAIVALAACAKVAPVVEEPAEEANREIKVNFNISRSDIADATKATVKTGWVEDDVVFVFFADVTSPSATKYLELKYNGSTWDADLHDLTASDFKEEGKITAIYLPYGSDYTVAYADESFTIKSAGADYSGHFYISEKADYDFAGSTLTGTISLIAATPVDADDKLIHFDVTGYTSGHEYDMYQDYMKPISLTSIALDGTVNKTIGSMGEAIPGYEDEAFMSFSGVLDKSAKTEKDWQFSINDVTASVLYTRDAGNRTVSKNKYIGIGSISTATWNANEYVDLGIVYDGKRVMWAKKNLGATAETGEGSYGKYYAWGDFVGYALDGTYGSYTCSHTFEAESQSVPFDHLMTMTDESTPSYMQFRLKPEYDPAHEELKGLWRMPIEYKGMMDGKYRGEMVLLRSNTTQTLSGTLGTVTAGFIFSGNGNTMFVPFAGCIEGDALLNYDNPWHIVNYLTSGCLRNTSGAVRNSFLKFFVGYNESNGKSMISYSETTTGDGFLIRPCFSIK